MDIVIIAAIAANGVIGRDGTLPWHLPADLAHFKETTMGYPVIMGRVAFESVLELLGGPLPGRTNIILTSQSPQYPDEVVVVHDIDGALASAEACGASQVFVAGGATVYEQFLPLADRLLLSEIHASYAGDVSFPVWPVEGWRERRRDSNEEFDIVEYEPVAV